MGVLGHLRLVTVEGWPGGEKKEASSEKKKGVPWKPGGGKGKR